MKNYSVAIVGATGAVGRMMLKVLEEQNFPISELYLLASKRSKNKTNTRYSSKNSFWFKDMGRYILAR